MFKLYQKAFPVCVCPNTFTSNPHRIVVKNQDRRYLLFEFLIDPRGYLPVYGAAVAVASSFKHVFRCESDDKNYIT